MISNPQPAKTVTDLLQRFIGNPVKLRVAANSLNFTFYNGEYLYVHPLWRYECDGKVVLTSHDFLNYDAPNYKSDFNRRCIDLSVLDDIQLKGVILSEQLDLTLKFENGHLIRQFHQNSTQEETQDLIGSGWWFFRKTETLIVTANCILAD